MSIIMRTSSAPPIRRYLTTTHERHNYTYTIQAPPRNPTVHATSDPMMLWVRSIDTMLPLFPWLVVAGEPAPPVEPLDPPDPPPEDPEEPPVGKEGVNVGEEEARQAVAAAAGSEGTVVTTVAFPEKSQD